MKFQNFWTLACLAFFLASPMTGAFAQNLTHEQERKDDQYIGALAERSDLVIIGEVIRNQPQWYGRTIVTLSEIQPLSTLKGEPPGENISVVFFGGTVGVINQEFTHSATLREGEVVVLFLSRGRDEVSEKLDSFRIIDEEGKILLLYPGQSKTRLDNNQRLVRYLDYLEGLVNQGGSEQ